MFLCSGLSRRLHDAAISHSTDYTAFSVAKIVDDETKIGNRKKSNWKKCIVWLRTANRLKTFRKSRKKRSWQRVCMNFDIVHSSFSSAFLFLPFFLHRMQSLFSFVFEHCSSREKRTRALQIDFSQKRNKWRIITEIYTTKAIHPVLLKCFWIFFFSKIVHLLMRLKISF